MTKNIGIITTSFIIECDEQTNQKALEATVDSLNDKIIELIESTDLQAYSTVQNLEWLSSQVGVLDVATANLGRCQHCGCWVSDRLRPNYIAEVSIGTFYQGKLLCDVCLPKDHELAF